VDIYTTSLSEKIFTRCQGHLDLFLTGIPRNGCF